ncbi:MAG: hypothetical protein LUD47_06210, partial [Clostridia bacterium]|nr:hypothetical protein [Clostridia bacterium]
MSKKTNGAFGLKKLSPYIKPYRGMFAAMMIITVFVGVCDTVLALFQEYAIDNFILGETLHHLWVFVLIFALLIIVCNGTDFFGSYTCC